MSQQTLTLTQIEEQFQNNEQRPELNITGDDQYKKTAVISATPPVDPTYAHKLNKESSGAVAETITKLTDLFNAPVETITYPRPVPLPGLDIEAVMCHVFHISPHFVDGLALQPELGDFDKKVAEHGFEAAYNIVEDAFPDVYDIEPGDFDLEPIAAGGSVSVSRLVSTGTEELSGVGKIESNAMENVFDALTHACEPFIHQLITEPDNGTLYITARLAPLSTDHTFVGDRGLARLLREGSAADLAPAFEKVGVTSNFNIDLSDHLHIEYNRQIDGQTRHSVQINDAMRKRYDTKTQHKRKVDSLKKAVLGQADFTPMLRGATDWDPLLKEQGYYGRFFIPPSAIGYFTEEYVHYYYQDPWQYTPVRGAPVLIPRPIKEIETQTDWGAPSPDIDEEKRHQTDGSDDHLKLGDRVDNFGTARGDTINRIEQDGSSLPDYELITADGFINMLEKYVESDIANLEPEWKNSSKPANILTNVERAIAADRHVIVVLKDEDKAERAYKALRTTYKRLTKFGAQTYQGDAIPTIDGKMLVTSESESTWNLTPDDMLVHVIDDEIVTRCPADADLTEVEHGCATARTDGSRIIVTTRDGETLTYQSENAFKREWSRVTTPHVPVDISYLQHVSIMYETGTASEQTGEFAEFEPTPAWERADGKQARYNEFGATVTEDFLVEAPGMDLTVDECHSTMMRVYQWSTDKSAPGTGWFSKGLPDHIERKDNAAGKKQLKDYTWVFSRGLVSPHLRSIDADADLTL